MDIHVEERESAPISFSHIQQLIQSELQAVEAILAAPHASIPLITEISHHMLQAGGKRLRPMIVLLFSLACGYRGNKHIQLAAILELIHAATLLHDDVVDASSKRRSQPTANAVWDNKMAVLSGDYVYALAFQKMTTLQNPDILAVLAAATSYIVEGEILQLNQQQQILIEESVYLDVIDRKTARLFSVAAESAAMLGHMSPSLIRACSAFGQGFGAAYQIINDIQDYSEQTQITGKNRGDDLAEGKPTLPFILAYTKAQQSERDTLLAVLQQQAPQEAAFDLIHHYDTLNASSAYAKRLLQQALSHLAVLPSSPYQEAIEQLTQVVIRLAPSS
jgi:octaprenyl-diphosphate synthase